MADSQIRPFKIKATISFTTRIWSIVSISSIKHLVIYLESQLLYPDAQHHEHEQYSHVNTANYFLESEQYISELFYKNTNIFTRLNQPSKRKIHLYNIGTKSDQHCINIIQMFCVYWEPCYVATHWIETISTKTILDHGLQCWSNSEPTLMWLLYLHETASRT